MEDFCSQANEDDAVTLALTVLGTAVITCKPIRARAFPQHCAPFLGPWAGITGTVGQNSGAVAELWGGAKDLKAGAAGPERPGMAG